MLYIHKPFSAFRCRCFEANICTTQDHMDAGALRALSRMFRVWVQGMGGAGLGVP